MILKKFKGAEAQLGDHLQYGEVSQLPGEAICTNWALKSSLDSQTSTKENTHQWNGFLRPEIKTTPILRPDSLCVYYKLG